MQSKNGGRFDEDEEEDQDRFSASGADNSMKMQNS